MIPRTTNSPHCLAGRHVGWTRVEVHRRPVSRHAEEPDSACWNGWSIGRKSRCSDMYSTDVVHHISSSTLYIGDTLYDIAAFPMR